MGWSSFSDVLGVAQDSARRAIELDGEDLRPAPLEERKGKLEKLLARGDGIRFSEHLDGDGATIFEHACKLGLEMVRMKAHAKKEEEDE